MTNKPTVWGLHMGHHVGRRPIEEGYVAFGWHEIGDPSAIENGREGLKAALLVNVPGENTH